MTYVLYAFIFLGGYGASLLVAWARRNGTVSAGVADLCRKLEDPFAEWTSRPSMHLGRCNLHLTGATKGAELIVVYPLGDYCDPSPGLFTREGTTWAERDAIERSARIACSHIAQRKVGTLMSAAELERALRGAS